jgi:hypothetical protein
MTSIACWSVSRHRKSIPRSKRQPLRTGADHATSGHHFWTPPHRHLLPCHPLRAPLGEVLTLRNQTLMNGAGEKGDAVPADLVAEVLASDADRPRAGWFEDIPLKELPFLRGDGRWQSP